MPEYQALQFYQRVMNLCGNRSRNSIEDQIGLSKSSIEKWKKSAPKLDTACKVASFFGVSLDYLALGIEERDNITHYSEEDLTLLQGFEACNSDEKRIISHIVRDALGRKYGKSEMSSTINGSTMTA